MKKKMRIYVATPVNGRREATLELKRKEANVRCTYLKVMLRERFPDAEVVCSFDVCPIIGEPIEEHTAMGRCVDLLMTCDSIYMDVGWQSSKGCNVEYTTAKVYGLKIMKGV